MPLLPRPSLEVGAVALPRRGPGRTPKGDAALRMLLAALTALAAAGAALGAEDRLRQITKAEFDRQRKQKAVSQALASAPVPPLRPEDEDEIKRDAGELDVDPARFEALARDPARGGQVDAGTIEEARVAVRLERIGKLTDVVRSPHVGAEFIEDGGAGRSWDVKSFRSDGFDLNEVTTDMQAEFNSGNGVIINSAHLEPAQVEEIQQMVDARGWSSRVIYASSE